MIKLFTATTKDFASNGDKILQPFKCKVRHDENFYLNIETSLAYADWMTEGNIIVCPTPQGEQAFRVSNVEKTGTKITAKCYHVFYDTKRYLIRDSYVVNKTTNAALAWLNDAADPESPFTTFSDVPGVDSYRCVRESLYNAILKVQERWGGHLFMDNFSISLLGSIGSDDGITVRYRKNLREISVSEDWDEVVTKLLPVGKDGILLNALDPSASVYLYSVRQYDIPYTKSVSFEQDISQEDYPDETTYKTALVADLRRQALAYLELNSVPKVNYTLNAAIDRVVNIGDTIDVIDERLGVDIMTEVISYEFDCLTGRITELEFGNFKPTLSGFTSHITSQIDQTVRVATDQLSTKVDETDVKTNEIIETMSDSYVIYNGSEILVVDSLPKSTATNVIKIGGSGGLSISHDGIDGTYEPIITLDGTIGYLHAAEITPSGLATAFDLQEVEVAGVTSFVYDSFTLALPEAIKDLNPVILELTGSIRNMDGTYVAESTDLMSYVSAASLSRNLLTITLTLTDMCVIYIDSLRVRLEV